MEYFIRNETLRVLWRIHQIPNVDLSGPINASCRSLTSDMRGLSFMARDLSIQYMATLRMVKIARIAAAVLINATPVL